jgi:penicillin-binding protein 1B
MGTSKKKKRKRSRKARRSRHGKIRVLVGVLVPILVLAATAAVYLHVEVTSKFEGMLWETPSRVYSDRLVVFTGSELAPASLTGRLDRAGYAPVNTEPSTPGQYRYRDRTLDVYLRPFEGSPERLEARRRMVRFGRGKVLAIVDQRGRRFERVVLEPELLATLFGPRQEEREVVALDRFQSSLTEAVLAAEDSRFYSHGGVDLRAIVRAALANLRRGQIVQGGSTITQQTVKNLYLGQERSWWRKIREVVMAVLLDREYTKDRILEVYLNEVYLGQRGPVAICGFQAASRFYFGRDLGDLSLGEQALLAGLIRNPGGYNPFLHPQRAIARRGQVLDAMVRLGQLEPAEADLARGETLRLASGAGGFSRAPYVIDFVRKRLDEIFEEQGRPKDGFKVFTTLNTRYQDAAREALSIGLERLERSAPLVRRERGKRTLQGLLLVLEPRSGEILAMVGGRDYRESQFNRAVQAERQPGSCFKPFVYLAGFDAAVRRERGGLTPASVLEDEPFELASGGKTWRPANYDGRFRGPVSARQALEDSLNVPTVRAAERVGLRPVARLAERAGMRVFRPLPSLALGAQEVTPLSLAAAYAILANEGRRVDPRIIRQVSGAGGQRWNRGKAAGGQVVSAQAAYLVTDVLRGVMTRGTGQSSEALGFHGTAAGKTGTTDDTRDSWFVGYTPEILAMVWIGFDDNARTGLTGASGALPIWVDFMKRAGHADSWAPFQEPEGLVRRLIDPETGMLAVGGCPVRYPELFVEGTEPRQRCSVHSPGFFRWLRERFRRRPV